MPALEAQARADPRSVARPTGSLKERRSPGAQRAAGSPLAVRRPSTSPAATQRPASADRLDSVPAATTAELVVLPRAATPPAVSTTAATHHPDLCRAAASSVPTPRVAATSVVVRQA